MLKKIWGIGMVAVLAIALIVGSLYIMLRPEDTQAERVDVGGNRQATSANAVQGAGGNGPRDSQGVRDVDDCDGTEASGYQGSPGAGAAQAIEAGDWQTVTGEVTVADGEVAVATDVGEVLIGMGPAWYREEAGFVVQAGEQVRVRGFYADGEFKAGTVENLSTAQQIQLRDATGRPGWAGRG